MYNLTGARDQASWHLTRQLHWIWSWRWQAKYTSLEKQADGVCSQGYVPVPLSFWLHISHDCWGFRRLSCANFKVDFVTYSSRVRAPKSQHYLKAGPFVCNQCQHRSGSGQCSPVTFSRERNSTFLSCFLLFREGKYPTQTTSKCRNRKNSSSLKKTTMTVN